MVYYNLPLPKEWEGGTHWDYFVDLRGVNNSNDILRCFAKVFHGTHSELGGLQNTPNLNWLGDIAFDFFFENWGNSKLILVAGGETAGILERITLFSAIECVNEAFRNVLVEKARFGTSGEDIFQENLKNFTLHVYMS